MHMYVVFTNVWVGVKSDTVFDTQISSEVGLVQRVFPVYFLPSLICILFHGYMDTINPNKKRCMARSTATVQMNDYGGI